MPRIHGYKERLYANYFDGFSLLDMGEYVRLFGNRNVGTPHMSNMQLAEQLPGDMTMVIANVYTRTNLGRPRPQLEDKQLREVQQLFAEGHEGDAVGTLLRELQHERTPLARALEEWANVARVHLEIGSRPYLNMSFAELMDGPALGPSHLPLAKKKDQPTGEEVEHLPWRKQLGRCLLVPVRQCFRVRVDAPTAPTQALRHLATEAGVLPEPLAWVHLEGLTTRDIY